jgi:endonuclease-3
MTSKLKLSQLQSRMKKVLDTLEREYPEAHCSLDYKTPFQLLAATVLSAQCTDERVNIVTPILFNKWPDSSSMSRARVADIEAVIRSTGFFKNKALSLSELSKKLVSDHGGEVPQTLGELTALRGVGRKTANVVLGNAFGIPGLVVDTHVGRLCRRMGFTRANDPEVVEREMMEIVERKQWTQFSHYLIAHGRAICSARKALCDECPVVRMCDQKMG